LQQASTVFFSSANIFLFSQLEFIVCHAKGLSTSCPNLIVSWLRFYALTTGGKYAKCYGTIQRHLLPDGKNSKTIENRSHRNGLEI